MRIRFRVHGGRQCCSGGSGGGSGSIQSTAATIAGYVSSDVVVGGRKGNVAMVSNGNGTDPHFTARFADLLFRRQAAAITVAVAIAIDGGNHGDETVSVAMMMTGVFLLVNGRQARRGGAMNNRFGFGLGSWSLLQLLLLWRMEMPALFGNGRHGASFVVVRGGGVEIGRKVDRSDRIVIIICDGIVVRAVAVAVGPIATTTTHDKVLTVWRRGARVRWNDIHGQLVVNRFLDEQK